jgi:hypothetical protein
MIIYPILFSLFAYKKQRLLAQSRYFVYISVKKWTFALNATKKQQHKLEMRMMILSFVSQQLLCGEQKKRRRRIINKEKLFV